MDCAFPDEQSESLPFEADMLPHNLAWAQDLPQSTLGFLEQNHPLPVSDYAPCMQPPWALNGFNFNMPTTSVEVGFDSTTGWVGDNASPVGANNTMDSSWMQFENSGSNGYRQGHCSAPTAEPLKEATRGNSPADDCTSRSRRSKSNAK
ncbi:transcriptional regulator family: C2H2 zinc finger [Penicillium sp. IBT 35674x]|nr:transcriptional regulator family: C2H2 zinc finger [Penicillium sp. IBT 35674x]